MSGLLVVLPPVIETNIPVSGLYCSATVERICLLRATAGDCMGTTVECLESAHRPSYIHILSNFQPPQLEAVTEFEGVVKVIEGVLEYSRQWGMYTHVPEVTKKDFIHVQLKYMHMYVN